MSWSHCLQSYHYNRYENIQDVLNDDKSVCIHSSLKGIMERFYPTNIENFNYSKTSDVDRLLMLQLNENCDGIIISRYSLDLIATYVENDVVPIESCDGLYPLYNEELFTQDVIVPISQTLGDLGDELIDIMNTMIDKKLYRDLHDERIGQLRDECQFEALGEPDGVVIQSFYSPFIFTMILAGFALIIGIRQFIRKERNRQKEVESEEDDCQGAKSKGDCARDDLDSISI